MSDQLDRVQRTLAVDGTAKITKFSDIEARKLEWLWPERIPLGKLTCIAGDPGLGKSLVTIAITATITSDNEIKWPDGCGYAPHGSVILLSAEDDDGDTIKPRLIAAGANTEKVFSFDSVIYEDNGKRRGFTIDRDFEKLEQAIIAIKDCRLVVIDPISAFMGKIDSHNNSDVRGVLSLLSDIAQKQRVAVLYVTHLNKGDGAPMARVTGSGAYVAAARSVMLVGPDPDNTRRRVVAMLKANLAKESDGVAYEVRSNEDDLPVVQWEPGSIDIRASDILSSERSDARHERNDAADWLEAELHYGPVSVLELQERVAAAGHAWRTVRRAKDSLGIKAKKNGPGGSWQWWHPKDLENIQDGHDTPPGNVGHVGHVGHLNNEDGQGGQGGQEIREG